MDNVLKQIVTDKYIKNKKLTIHNGKYKSGV